MKNEISAENNKTILMLGYLCISNLHDGASLYNKISILDRFGLNDSEIAAICACNKQSIADARHRNKKKNNFN